jgi:hypothetical protein
MKIHLAVPELLQMNRQADMAELKGAVCDILL